jgi:hypothetical protein
MQNTLKTLSNDLEILDYFGLKDDFEEIKKRQNFLRSLDHYSPSVPGISNDIFFTVVDEKTFPTSDIINIVKIEKSDPELFKSKRREMISLLKGSDFYNIFDGFKVSRHRKNVLSDIVSHVDDYIKGVTHYLTIYYGMLKHPDATYALSWLASRAAINAAKAKQILKNKEQDINQIFEVQDCVYKNVEVRDDLLDYVELLNTYIKISNEYFSDINLDESDFFVMGDKATSKLRISQESFDRMNEDWDVKKISKIDDLLVNVSICYMC